VSFSSKYQKIIWQYIDDFSLNQMGIGYEFLFSLKFSFLFVHNMKKKVSVYYFRGDHLQNLLRINTVEPLYSQFAFA